MNSRTFLDLLKIVYAAYNQEVMGTMFGTWSNNNYYIDSVIPAQKTLIKKPTLVVISANQSGRLENTVERVEKCLGYFHSHCMYWNNDEFVKASLTPSNEDLESFLDEDYSMFLISAVNESNRRMAPCIKDNYISGTFNGIPGKKYHIAVRVYYKDANRHRIGKIKIPEARLKKIFL